LALGRALASLLDTASGNLALCSHRLSAADLIASAIWLSARFLCGARLIAMADSPLAMNSSGEGGCWRCLTVSKTAKSRRVSPFVEVTHTPMQSPNGWILTASTDWPAVSLPSAEAGGYCQQ